MKRLMSLFLSLIVYWMVFLPGAGAFVPDAGTGDRWFDDRYRIVSAYGGAIESAARRFDIPPQILVGVILTESGGDPWAVTRLSSAKGLMQTIDTTFEMAWKGLREQGIHIKRTPFHPEASIMAGAWYLDQMYQRAVSDGLADPVRRHDPAAWEKPLEYYYAGPENGAKPGSRVRVCSRGQCRTIDKSAYSAKVLGFAGGVRSMPVKTAVLAEPALADSSGLPHPMYGATRIFSDYQHSIDKGFD
jgi:hypothetical protein